MAEQNPLLTLPEQPAAQTAPEPAVAEGRSGKPAKLLRADRRQCHLVAVDVERLIPETHKARAIWSLCSRLDTTPFLASVRTAEGRAGRPAWDPVVLISIWLYSYSEGIHSAREVERHMQHEPGLRWLTGLEIINHHTLSDFRVEHKEALDKIFSELLAVLEAADLVTLERLMHDGTKIRAHAGGDTFRRQKTIEERLAEARVVVEQMGDPRQEESVRQAAARRRASRERTQKIEDALKELKLLTGKPKSKRKSKRKKQQEEPRVSITEPEARVMKHGDGGYAPSYNVQLSTDAQQKIITTVRVTQSASDSGELWPSLDNFKDAHGRLPRQVVVDGGFTTRKAILQAAEEGVDLIGSLTDPSGRKAAGLKQAGIDPAFGSSAFVVLDNAQALACPAGKRLRLGRTTTQDGVLQRQYKARPEDCGGCAHQALCCPKSRARSVQLSEEAAEVTAFRAKMDTEEARQIYRQRGAVAEFPNAWIKEKLQLRKFRLRGLAKAGIEALWACLTYNVMQWMRLCWLPERRNSAA